MYVSVSVLDRHLPDLESRKLSRCPKPAISFRPGLDAWHPSLQQVSSDFVHSLQPYFRRLWPWSFLKKCFSTFLVEQFNTVCPLLQINSPLRAIFPCTMYFWQERIKRVYNSLDMPPFFKLNSTFNLHKTVQISLSQSDKYSIKMQHKHINTKQEETGYFKNSVAVKSLTMNESW